MYIVEAGTDTASVEAGGFIGSVIAHGSVTGAVTAGSYIGGSNSQDLYAFYGSGVWAGGDVAAPVTAGGGIASVAAASNLAATITAGGAIWYVRSGASPIGGVGNLAAAVTFISLLSTATSRPI